MRQVWKAGRGCYLEAYGYLYKSNFVCRICGYNCRDFSGHHGLPYKLANSSRHCPIHGDTMVSLGMLIKIPKKRKDRIRLANQMRRA